MTIRRARADEAPVAESILREVAQWLADHGRTLWAPHEITLARIAPYAEANELVLGFEADRPVACMFLQNEDPAFWPEAASGEAYYVHRLAVRRAHAGSGWSRKLLDWGCAKARRDGRNFVRLDTELRPELLWLYEANGFRRVDAEPLPIRGHMVVRFERRV